MAESFRRRAKIVCTLGPSSSSVEQIEKLIREGLDVARLNFSHGGHDFHRRLIGNVREAARRADKYVAIMQDLQGPKIRAGMLPHEGVAFAEGDVLLLHPEGTDPKMSTRGRRPVPVSAEIAGPVSRDVSVGARILFDDGKISTFVREVNSPEIVVEVEVGGVLRSRKGMNLPGTPLSIPCITEKDYHDLEFGLSMGVDAVALSFVRSAGDIDRLRDRIIQTSNERPFLVSKIEREEAVLDQNAIIEVSDGLLVARGDMAVEVGAGRVPVIQKQLIHGCNEVGTPVITATQMLESMISSPTPTRAEASDVANAVFDGTDAVMLSGETASGAYPVQAVRTMARIVLQAERSADRYSLHPQVLPMAGSVVDSVEFSAARIAQHTGAACIACLTHSGMAARTVAKYRPDTQIVAIMDSEESLRKMAFVWGVRGVKIDRIVGTDDLFGMVERVLEANGYAARGDNIIVTAGVPTLRRGTTNMIKVHRIGANIERGRSVLMNNYNG